MGTGTDSEYYDGRRAVWRELLAQAVAALGLEDEQAQAAAWALERREVEEELRELWLTFASTVYKPDGGQDHDAGSRPFPEGVSLAEALRQFGEYL